MFIYRYKETFNRLRTLKSEIEHLQHLLEKAKVKLMKDFELWWADQMALSQVYWMFTIYSPKSSIFFFKYFKDQYVYKQEACFRRLRYFYETFL